MEQELPNTLDILKLENEINDQRNSLSTDRLDMSFGEIMSMYEREEIIIDPDFQRLFRWNIDQQTRFIESLLLGIPIPPIFVAENVEGKWELVDGLQRTSTLLSFFGILKTMPEKNMWVLQEGERIPSLEGFNIESLPSKFKLNLKRSTCRIEIIRWNSNYDMRFELFNRLNTGGTPLTAQEIRNCIYRGISTTFNDFLKELANSSDFLELVKLSNDQIEELYNEELVLRFLSLYNDYTTIKGSISNHMTEYMKDAISNGDYNYNENRQLFYQLINILKNLDYTIFRHATGEFATALYDTITIGLAKHINKYSNSNKDELLQKIAEVKTDKVLIKFSRKGGNNQKARIKNRLKEADRIFG
jgi:hypothetical protein